MRGDRSESSGEGSSGEGTTADDTADHWDRHETEAERDDRNLAELLQELRVAGLGVQVLFGFLLSLPFTVRFVKLDQLQRDLYVTSLLLAALATALLVGPVAYHRMVFRQHRKERLLRVANVLAIFGLAAVCLAISTAVALVLSFVMGPVAAAVLSVATVCAFGGLWFTLPRLGTGTSSRGRRVRGGPERAHP